MKLEHVKAALIGYAVAGLICFGPAVVEEDALEAAKKVECEQMWSGDLNVSSCKAWARNEFRPLLKSMFWPFWLSYRAAYTFSSPSQGSRNG